jgi:hypothetical protein
MTVFCTSQRRKSGKLNPKKKVVAEIKTRGIFICGENQKLRVNRIIVLKSLQQLGNEISEFAAMTRRKVFLPF